MNLVYLCLFTTVWSAKERVSDQNLEQITDQLFHEIEKRLQAFDSESSDYQDVKDIKRINAKTSNDTIIKTKESIAAGAIFLDAPDAKSGSQCLKKCFDNGDCNLAVFKEKMGDTSCYMFDCGNPSVCQFIQHENFITIELPDRKTSKISGVHEDDLERLAAPPTTTPQPSTDTVTTTTTTTTTTALNPTTLQVHRQVALYGQCVEDTDCSDSHAECEAGYCMCKRGFTYQDDVCREDCTKFQFKCANEGQPLVYPQCVAIYDKCDDFIHCKDGSDEENCEKDPAVDTSNEAISNKKHDDVMPGYGRHNYKPLPSEQDKPQGLETPTDKEDPSEVNAVDKNKPDIKVDESAEEPIVMPTKQDKVEQQDAAKSSKNEQDSSSEHIDDNGTNLNMDSDQTDVNVDVEESKEDDNSQETEEKKDDSAEKDTEDTKETDDHNVPVKQEEVINDDDDDDNNVGHKTAVIDTAIVDVVEERRYVIVSNRGAVVALSLGLVITFMLLVFVGCRLRNVRKRIRHGRPMNSNEADYLINGMYL